MPYFAFVEYTGDGGTTTFPFGFPFLEDSDVTVYVDGVATGRTLVSSPAQAVVLAPAPILGAVIRIQRETEIAESIVDFQTSSTIRPTDLDSLAEQMLLVSQETRDFAGEAVVTADAAAVDAAEAVVTANLALDTADAAVVTSNSALVTANAALVTANDALDTAGNANTNANAALLASGLASAAADAAVITANAADFKADLAISDSAEALATANEAIVTADGAAVDAEEAVETAESVLGLTNSILALLPSIGSYVDYGDLSIPTTVVEDYGDLSDTPSPTNIVDYGGLGVTYALATPATDGLMSAADKTKLDGMPDPTITKESTGFDIPDLVGVSYDGTTRKVTLSGTGWKAYWRGSQVSILTDGWVSEAHSISDGTYFLYYNGTSFVWGITPWDFSMLHIALVYRDGVNFCIRECHGLMQWQVHQDFHEAVGSYLRSGGDMSGYTLSSTTAANRRPDISAATVVDEDLATVNPALTSELYTQLTLSDANTANVTVDQAEILPVTGSQPFYNQYNGSTWVQTGFPVNAYGKIFVVAIPTTADTTCAKSRFLFIQPQTASTSLSTIQAITPASVNWGHLAGAIPEFIFIGEIVVRYQSGNWVLTSAAKLTGTKISQVTSTPGLTTVSTDSTLTGEGTVTSPLSVQDSLDLKVDTVRPYGSIITSGLVRRYLLDGDAQDSSGNGAHGTWSAAEQYGVGLALNRKAAYFIGTNQITYPDTGLPSGTNPSTIGLWLRTQNPATRGLCGYGTSGTSSLYRVIKALGSGTFAYNYDVYNFSISSPNYMAVASGWDCVYATYNGATSLLYVNGVLCISGTIVHSTALTGTAYIGTMPGTASRLTGYVSDHRVYDRALSADEIYAIATCTEAQFLAP